MQTLSPGNWSVLLTPAMLSSLMMRSFSSDGLSLFHLVDWVVVSPCCTVTIMPRLPLGLISMAKFDIFAAINSDKIFS